MKFWIATDRYIGFIDYSQIAHLEVTREVDKLNSGTQEVTFLATITLNSGVALGFDGPEAENIWYKVQNRKLAVNPDPASGF